MTREESTHLSRRLREEGRRTVAFFESLAEGDWDQSVYPGASGWRVRDVLAHFVSAEAAYLRFLRDTLSGGAGLPKDFDIDAFNAAEVPGLSTRPPEELLGSYREIREQTSALAASLSAQDLLLDGYHPWFGVMKIAWYLRLCYNHNSIHLRDVRRALAAVDPPEEAPGEIVMTDRKESLREALQKAHAASWSVLSGLTPEEFDVKVYAGTPEGWTVRLVVAHLADAERGLLGQARRVLEGRSGVPSDFDRDRWNRSAVRRKASASVPELLQEIEDGHKEALSFLEDLNEEGLDRSGMGSMGYALTVEGFLRRMVEHREEHVNDIRKAVGR